MRRYQQCRLSAVFVSNLVRSANTADRKSSGNRTHDDNHKHICDDNNILNCNTTVLTIDTVAG